VEIEVEVGVECPRVAGEAVHDTADPAFPLRRHDRQEVVVGRPLVHEHGQTALGCQLELRAKRIALRRSRRKIAIVVEPALADRDHAGLARQPAPRARAGCFALCG
jgi:hypothetical protein